jgi:hypothetical protein
MALEKPRASPHREPTPTTAAGKAVAPASEGTTTPHEARAQLLERHRNLLDQRQQALTQEKSFGTRAGEYEAKLENTANEVHRKRLEQAIEEAEKKEMDAKGRVAEIDRDIAALNDRLRDLAQQGVEPGSQYVPRVVGRTDLVPLSALDRPPAGVLESTGAEAVRGERIRGQRVLGAVESEAAMRTHIEAGAAEDFGYKDSLSRGEIGLQRPGRINESGVDYVTARRNAAGQIEIVLNDATLDVNKSIDAVPTAWFDEAEDAIAIREDGSTRLQLYNPTLEAEIRDALAQGRFVLEATLIEIGPDGVRFRLLSSTPVSPPAKVGP